MEDYVWAEYVNFKRDMWRLHDSTTETQSLNVNHKQKEQQFKFVDNINI